MRVTTVEPQQDGTSKEVTKETLSKFKLEKNSKGYNWEISVDFDNHDESSVAKAINDLKTYNDLFQQTYGNKGE